jgi:hypothetical protein
MCRRRNRETETVASEQVEASGLKRFIPVVPQRTALDGTSPLQRRCHGAFARFFCGTPLRACRILHAAVVSAQDPARSWERGRRAWPPRRTAEAPALDSAARSGVLGGSPRSESRSAAALVTSPG